MTTKPLTEEQIMDEMELAMHLWLTKEAHGLIDDAGAAVGFRAGWAKADINAAGAVLKSKAALKEQSDALNLAIAKKECDRLSTENVALRRLQELRKNQEPATEKTAEPDAGTIPVWTAHGMTKEAWIENIKERQQRCISGGQSEIKPDTFSDRLNALRMALEAIDKVWQRSCSMQVDARKARQDIVDSIAAIARECGGAK